MVPEVLARDLVLGEAALLGEVRRDRREQAGVGHEPQTDRGERRRQELFELGHDPLAREVGDEVGAGLDPGQRRRLDAEPEGRRETDGPDHPQCVLLEPGTRVADGAQGRGLDVGHAVVRIEEPRQPVRTSAPGHRVDRVVAAGEVELDGVTEFDPMRPSEVGVLVVAAEGRDLEGGAVASDADRPEAVLVDGAGKEFDDAFGKGVRGEVPVGRHATDDDVAQ